jgi:hypothetical protein
MELPSGLEEYGFLDWAKKSGLKTDGIDTPLVSMRLQYQCNKCISVLLYFYLCTSMLPSPFLAERSITAVMSASILAFSIFEQMGAVSVANIIPLLSMQTGRYEWAALIRSIVSL